MKAHIGIIEIRNMLTDYCYYTSSTDTFNGCAQERFKLDLGTHSCASLQEDYEKTGLELFFIHEVEQVLTEEELAPTLEKWKNDCEHLYN